MSCADIFTDAVSINSSSGTLSLGWHADLADGGATIDAPILVDNSSWSACSGNNCVSSGSAADTSNVSIQTGSASDGDISVGFRGSASYGQGDYGNVVLGSRADLSFTTTNGTYYMSSISAGSRSTLYLAPGDYWVDGDVFIGSNANIEPIGSGPVRIFVNGDITFNSDSRTTQFDPENLFFYAVGDVDIYSQARVDGFIYSEGGTVELQWQARVTGGISAPNITLQSQSHATYDPTALASADFQPFCSAIVFVTPVPIAGYHLEDSAWLGLANEVVDYSGNGLHGQSVNNNALPTTDDTNPAISGNPGTCGYGEFDGTADGYVVISDPGTNSILDLSDNFSVSVWIYPRAYPSSGLYTIVSKDENFEFHLNSSGQVNWWWGGGSRELISTSSVPLNTWSHITITYESGSQIIYLNGSAIGSTNSTDAVTLNNDDLFIGTDLNFHSRRINALIDEVNVYDITLTEAQVAYVRDETHPCAVPTVDHYNISHSGSGITCESELLTATAHDSSEASVDVAGSTIRLTATSSTSGWNTSYVTWSLASGAGSLSTPSAGVAEYTFALGETSVGLALANTFAADIDIDIVDTLDSNITDLDGNVTEDALLSFSDTGFRFYQDTDNDGDPDGTSAISSPLTAGVSSPQLLLKAVQTNSDTGACESRLSGTHTISMAYECVNPTSCIRNQDMAINSTNIEENDLSSVSDYSGVSLTFDADGEAPFTMEYWDAGNVRLHAQYSIPASGDDPAITLSGTSATTTVRPADLVISEVESSGASPNPGTTTSGSGFVAAGEAFRVVVQAQNDDGGTTPNFGGEISPEGIEIEALNLVMPTGGNLPALGSPNSFTVTSTPGEFENTTVSWSEVGTIQIRASILDDDYLGSGEVVGTTSGNVGRFYPDHFDLSAVSISQGCASGDFTYMSDQLFTFRPLDIGYTIHAHSASESVLSNYDAALAYPVGGFTAVAENNNSGTDLSSRLSITSETWVAGAYVGSASQNGGFSRLLSGTNEIPDGPFTSLQIGLRADGTDPDNTNFIASDLTMHASQSNDCISDGDCNAAAIASTLDLRFGRLFGRNSHGPETSALSVSLETQYWDGSEFILNSDDSCSTLTMSDIQFDSNTLSLDANRTVTVGGGSTTGSFTNFTAGVDMTFVSGDAGLNFSSPNIGNTGSFYVDIDLTNTPWLRFDWDNNGNHANDSSLPSLEINFGRYRGHDRVIFWREIF